MPDQIPIKIKQASAANHQDIKKALNLNQVLSFAKNSGRRKSSRIWIAVSIILFALSLALGAKIFLSAPKDYSQYQKAVPQNAKAVIFFKINELRDLAPTALPDLDRDDSFFHWLKDRVLKFLNDYDISTQDELLPYLNQDAAFFIPSSSSSKKPIWAIIGQVKLTPASQNPGVFDKIEQGLRQEFGLNELFYRQVKINSVYSFNQVQKAYYYSQVDNFILVSNDLFTLQEIIDEIVGK